MNKSEIQNHEMPLLTVIFTSFLCISFGSNAIAMKISLEGFGPFTTAGLRFALASGLILIWALFTRKPLLIKREQVPEIAILVVAFFLQLSGYHIGMSYTNASRATIIINVQPLLILLLAHYFIPGDRITGRKLAGVILGFTGVVMVFLDRAGGSTDLQFGDLIILGATLIWAGVSIYTKRIIHRYHPFQMVFYPMLLSFPLYFIAGYFLDRSMFIDPQLWSISGIIFQGVIAGAFGFVAWNTLLLKYGAVSLHTYIFLAPIAGVVFGGLILGEAISGKIVTSLLLIVSGIVVVNYRGRINYRN